MIQLKYTFDFGHNLQRLITRLFLVCNRSKYETHHLVTYILLGFVPLGQGKCSINKRGNFQSEIY